MHPRALELVHVLGLESHPEGGLFAQTFRSSLSVVPADSRGPRCALTLIYFLLVEGASSRWHAVRSDEAWHWYEGAPLELLVVPPSGGAVCSTILGPLSGISVPQCVVSAGCWQAARSRGAYTLVGCSVGPGFEYSDFTLLSSVPETERPPITPASVLTELL